MLFYLTSHSSIKLAALQDAVKNFPCPTVKSIIYNFDGKKQPIGHKEGLQCCYDRIRKSVGVLDVAKYTEFYIVAIENFVFELDSDGYLQDAACIVVRKMWREKVSHDWKAVDRKITTSSIPLPIKREFLEAGETYADKLFQRNIIVDPKDPHKSIIGVSRKEILSQGIKLVLNFFK